MECNYSSTGKKDDGRIVIIQIGYFCRPLCYPQLINSKILKIGEALCLVWGHNKEGTWRDCILLIARIVGEEPQRIRGNGIGERENRDSVNEFLCHPFSGFSFLIL